MAYQLQITTAQGSQIVPLDGIENGNIPADPSTSYTLIDEQGNPVTEDLSLTRKGDNLVLEVDGESVVNIEEFYSVDGSQYVVDGSAASAESTVISSSGLDASGNMIAEGVVWQAESGFLGLSTLQLVGAGLGSAVVVGAAASGSDSSSGSSTTPDTTAPTNTFTDAVYDETSNTLTLTGTGMNTLLSGAEDAMTDIKDNFNWDYLTWDINTDNDDSNNISFSLSDIDSVFVQDDNTLTITLTDTAESSLEGSTDFDALTSNDSITISEGFSSDTAGNISTTDGMERDTSIVVFDLVNGTSSNHSERAFDANINYTIYIIVDSNSENLDLDLSAMWSGADSNLNQDDMLVLVGNDAESQIVGFGNYEISAAYKVSGELRWRTNTGSGIDCAAIFTAEGGFERFSDGRSSIIDLFDGTLNINRIGVSSLYLQTMPTGILTSQGLA